MCITKHGKDWVEANIEKIKREMACPQCGHSYDDPVPYPYLESQKQGHFQLVRVYPPIEFDKETTTDVEFRCYSCDAEWLVKVSEPNMLFTKGRK